MPRPNPNIVSMIDRNSPATALLNLRKEADQTRRQNVIDESNLKTADINQRAGEEQLRGAQLQNTQTEQNIQAGILRSIAMDTLALRKLFDASDVAPEILPEAGNLGMDVVRRMEQIGAPTEDAMRLLRLGATDPRAAVEYMDQNTIPLLEARFPDLFKDEILSDSDVTPQGQVISKDWRGVVSARDVNDFTAESEDLTIFDQIMPDGSIRSIQADGKGNFFDMQGRKQTLEDDARLVRSTLSGSQDDLGLGRAELEKIRNAEAGTRTFIATANDAIRLLEAAPDVNTFIAGAAGLVNNLQQEVGALGRGLGIELDASFLDPETHKDSFDQLGIDNARMKSLITNLAYTQALANNPDGRVSNTDLNRAIVEIGGNASDPRTLSRVIRDVAARTDRAFRINYSTRFDKEFDGDLGLGTLGEMQDQGTGLEGLSDEEFNELLNRPIGQ